jgi:transposase
MVVVDEAGFYLLPAGVWTYAPGEQTPISRMPLTPDHLSAISAITPAGKPYMMVQVCAFKGPAIVRFLRHLLRHIPGKLLIIWDGLPAHRSQTVKDFMARGDARRIHLEQWPSYAPDLNPDEGIWRYLKYAEMKNLCRQTLDDLRYEWRKATARLRHKTDVILSCFKQARLGVPV